MKLMRKLSLLLLAVALLTACSKPAAPAPAASATPAPAPAPAPTALKPVSLVLDWYPNAAHAFILAAQEQGFFKAEGLTVDLKMPAENPTDGIKLVGAGKETFALYYQPDVLLARGEGIPIVSVAAIVRHPLNGIMVPTASGIKSPKDLVGKQVGYPGIPLNESMVKTMVTTNGGDPAKVTLTDVSFDLIPAIATKQVPAIAGGFLNHEKLVLEKQGIPMTYFAPTDFGVPNYYELVLIAGEQTVKQDRATVDAFWRALAKGQDWVKKNPDAAVKLLVAKQSKDFPLEADVETQSLQILLKLMEDPGVPFGAQSQQDWTKVAAWMAAQGALKATINPADAFVSITK
ncbi:MAG TPA: ABC transporter substrate-binding protein [Symbiobacteriaceae bacterium]|jgi:putative hydroxymethylpyrimidine transport system substrate-binding protein